MTPRRKYRYQIIKFEAWGQTFYRFAVPSILHPGEWSKSLHYWDSIEKAQRAARTCAKARIS